MSNDVQKKICLSRLSSNSFKKENNDSDIKVTSSIVRIKSRENINTSKKNSQISVKKFSNSQDNNIFVYNDKKLLVNKIIKNNSLEKPSHNDVDKKVNKIKENNRYYMFENEEISEKYDDFSERNTPIEKPKIPNFIHNYNKEINNYELNDNFEDIYRTSERREMMLRSNKNMKSSFLEDNCPTENVINLKKFIKFKNEDDNKEFKAKNHYLQYEKDAKKSHIFIILFSIGIVLSGINVAFCISLQFYGNQTVYLILGGISFFIIVIYIFGIKFILKDKKFVNKIIMNNDDPEKIEHSKARKNILLILYLLIITFYYYHVILLVNTTFINNIKLSIKGKGYDTSQWIELFKEENYTEILEMFEKINICFLVFSWLNKILLVFIIIYKIILIFNYRLIKSIMQLLCITTIQFGIIQIYLSFYCYRFRDVTSLEGIKLSWVTPGTMSNGFISIIIGIFGFYIFFIEDIKKITIFQLMVVSQFILLCVFSGGLTDIGDKFYNYKYAKCNSLFKFVSEEYLLKNKLSICSTKYLSSTETLNNFICPKDRIMINWERTEGSDEKDNDYEITDIKDKQSNNEGGNNIVFGCINQSCCLQIYFEIKNNFDILLILGISKILFYILLFILSIYIKRKINNVLEEEILEKKNILFIWIITLFIFLIALACIFSLPKSSNQSLLNDIDINEISDSLSIINKDLTTINNNNLYQYTNDSFNSIKKDIINNFKYNIIFDYMDKNDYEYELSSFEYIITTSDFDIKIINNKLQEINNYDYKFDSFENLTKIIKFESKDNIINNIFDYLYMVPFHPLKNTIELDIEINGIFINNENNNVIEKNNKINNYYNNINITKETIESNYNNDYNQSIITIIKKKLDFSIMTKNEFFYIKGKINNDKGNSLINIYNYHYNDIPIYSAKSNINGEYIAGPIYKLGNNIYYLSIEISKIIIDNINGNYHVDNNFCKYYDIIKISEFGFHSNNYYLINNIYLPERKTGYMNIVGKVIQYNDEEELLSDVYVSLFYENQINIINERIEHNQNDLNSLSLNDICLSTTTTNKNGEYSLNINNNGQYMIVFKKENYYLEKHIFTINDISSNAKLELGPMKLIDIFNSGKVVVKLEWDNKPPDLDLICRFQVTKNNYCYIFFGNKKCGKTEFFVDNREKNEISSEIIEISEFSDYIYLFYVRKYFDSSNGNALNEFKKDGLETKEKTNYTELDIKYNEYLNNTSARIFIYSNGFKIPALKINIPGFVKNEINQIEYNYWVAFCVNGKEGINSLKVVNELMQNEPPKNICLSYYDLNNIKSFSE